MHNNPYTPLEIPPELEDATPQPALLNDHGWAWGDRLVVRSKTKPLPVCARTNRTEGTMNYPDCALSPRAFRFLIWCSAFPGGVLLLTLLMFARVVGTWYEIRMTYEQFARTLVIGAPLALFWFGANTCAAAALAFGEWSAFVGLIGLSVVSGLAVRALERREFDARPLPPDYVVLKNVHPGYLSRLPELPSHLAEELKTAESRQALDSGGEQRLP